HYQIPKKALVAEILRFEQALERVRHDLETIKEQLPATAPAELAAFINTHLMILADKHLSEVPKAIIEQELCNAEWALKQQMNELVA
ncbi:phosphoenolpyruvate-utilizing N-terminal domain-containing protein, partial [Salmonella enterica]|uniref:phosphoenolpyruvate-utilizing N-terminal domain-containing protein n=1 Tax=Salmonella enterica TaxID=28901 RepID=UPI003CEC8CEA